MNDRQITDAAPLPLARAFRRYWNATGARERHDAAYFLFEIYLKYAASVAVARYAAGAPRDHRVNAALKGLVRPSLGEWLRFLRETLRFLTEGTGESDPLARAMADLLATRASRWESVLRLYNRLRSFLHDATGEKTQTSLGALLDEIVTYRNRVLGHGAPLEESHYRELASLFGDAFVEVFRASPFLTTLRLVSFPSIQLEAGSRIECEVIEHVGLLPARRAQPILRQLAPGSAPRKNALYLLDPAESLVLLDPLLIAHRDDVYFLNEARGAPEYLSYSSGERHRPASGGVALGELFARIVGYTPDASHLDRMGEDLTPPAAEALASGQVRRLGDYHVTREVGRGAMGVVFEAYQESLGRRVALKVLPGDFALDPKRLERFRREARATGRIHHPSIVPVYEVGETGGTHFYSMELIDGPSLADILAGARQEAAMTKPSAGSSIVSGEALARVIEQVALVADGLEEAHRQGLVHRDVKPSNILVDPPGSAPQGDATQRCVGRYVLVDFGLVRDEEAGTLTRSGEMVGTLSYMSPEQVSRRPVDRRTDVYSLGATLYEILTLRTPFGREGESEHAIQDAILFKEAVPPRKLQPRLSRDLETVVLKAIEKDPDRRYASAGEFAADLRRCLRGGPIEAKPTSAWTRLSRRALRNKLRLGLAASVLIAACAIGVLAWNLGERRAQRIARETLLPNYSSVAVLPLKNLSGDNGQDYLADGLTDALINDLAHVRGLRIISLTSALQYKGTTKSLLQIAKELKVDTIVEGSMVRSGNRVRISTRLVDGASERSLWSDSFERDLTDILTTEREIARTIAGRLTASLTPEEQSHFADPGRTNPDAYQAYLRGRLYWSQRTEQALRLGIDQFKSALEIDPSYAAAWSGLADCYTALGYGSYLTPKFAFLQAEEAAKKAIDLEPSLADPHASLGYVLLYYHWRFAEASKEFERAIELNPNYATAHHWYSVYLTVMEQPKEARRHIERAQELDPLSTAINTDMGFEQYYSADYEAATKQLNDVLVANPKFPLAHLWLARTYQALGRYSEAVQEYESTGPLREWVPTVAGIGNVYGVWGKPEEARRVLAHLGEMARDRYVTSYGVALVYAGMGDTEQAFAKLNEAVDERTHWLVWLNLDRRWESLRSDRRFGELKKRIGLPN